MKREATYAGGIYAPMDCKAPVRRLRRIMEVLDPAYVLTDRENRDKAGELMPENRVLLTDDLLECEADRERLQEIRRPFTLMLLCRICTVLYETVRPSISYPMVGLPFRLRCWNI
ncbi:MAG: hypothetical protein NC123_04245 [Butyrivibrio sp.]|nr:hypothetical protein [Acetatifactor muris]MCM1558738.1 hypothetical protein [Butyrivibrio sp.]